MALPFNPDEIFEMAIQIGGNGMRFYKRSAEAAGDNRSVRQLLTFLAKKEENHVSMLNEIRDKYFKQDEDDEFIDPEGRATHYLKTMANSYVYDVRKDPAQIMTGKESLQDVILLALNHTKESLMFFLGMKQMVPEHLGRAHIDEIIRDKMEHVQFLTKELRKVKKK
ncbi:hypothetical protein KDK77_02520 [bacterium]|nr:hypothetical protein [bacterium]